MLSRFRRRGNDDLLIRHRKVYLGLITELGFDSKRPHPLSQFSLGHPWGTVAAVVIDSFTIYDYNSHITIGSVRDVSISAGFGGCRHEARINRHTESSFE